MDSIDVEVNGHAVRITHAGVLVDGEPGPPVLDRHRTMTGLRVRLQSRWLFEVADTAEHEQVLLPHPCDDDTRHRITERLALAEHYCMSVLATGDVHAQDSAAALERCVNRTYRESGALDRGLSQLKGWERLKLATRAATVHRVSHYADTSADLAGFEAATWDAVHRWLLASPWKHLPLQQLTP